MQIDIPREEFLSFKTKKQRFDRVFTSRWPDIFRAIQSKVGAGFCVHKRSIMFFLLAATYTMGREGAQIMGYQFEKGIPRQNSDELICCGVGAAKNTIHKHLGELCEQDFINIYVSRNLKNGSESDARIFEINCKTLFPGGPNTEGGGDPKGTPHYMGVNGLAKANLPADRRGRVVNSSRGKVVALKAPKNGYRQLPAQIESSPTEVVAQIKSVATTRTATRVASAQSKAACDLTKDEMQALVDKHMATYRPQDPRMLVTNREHGHWRKKLKETAPDNFDKFLGWTIRKWTEIALQNRKSIKRREEAGQKGRAAMPLAPSFSALAYRYTYMLSAYVNDQASRGTAPEKEDRENKELSRAKAEIERLKQDHQTLKKRLSSRTVAPPPAPKVRVARTAPVRQKIDDEFGEWDDEPVGDTNAKRA